MKAQGHYFSFYFRDGMYDIKFRDSIDGIFCLEDCLHILVRAFKTEYDLSDEDIAISIADCLDKNHLNLASSVIETIRIFDDWRDGSARNYRIQKREERKARSIKSSRYYG